MSLIKRGKPAPAYAARLARLAKRKAPAAERPPAAPRLTFAQKNA